MFKAAGKCCEVLTFNGCRLCCCCLVGSENNSIVLLNLRANQLTGPATAVEGCGNLVQLDVSEWLIDVIGRFVTPASKTA